MESIKVLSPAGKAALEVFNNIRSQYDEIFETFNFKPDFTKRSLYDIAIILRTKFHVTIEDLKEAEARIPFTPFALYFGDTLVNTLKDAEWEYGNTVNDTYVKIKEGNMVIGILPFVAIMRFAANMETDIFKVYKEIGA